MRLNEIGEIVTDWIRDQLKADPPLFNRHCPTCGRFIGQIGCQVNGAVEVTDSWATCSKCGKVKPRLMGWASDFRTQHE